jgi:hypothetical protein
VPLVILLAPGGGRRVPILVASSLIFAGFWGECLLLVAPAAMPGLRAAIGVTAAFFVTFALIARFGSTRSFDAR